MKAKKLLAGLLSGVMLLSAIPLSEQVVVSAEGKSSFQTTFEEANDYEAQFRVRYWISAGWSGKDSYHRAEIDREMKEMADAGYTTVELADVHDMMSASEKEALGDIDASGSSYLYGSENWLKALEQVLKSAKKYGMTVDMTFGQRWPASSNEIKPDDDAAAKELVYGTKELTPEDTITVIESGIDTELAPILTSTSDTENPDISNELIGVYVARYSGAEDVTLPSGGFMQPGKSFKQYTVTGMEQVIFSGGSASVSVPALQAGDEGVVMIALYQRATGQDVGYQPSMDNNTGTNTDAYVIDHYSAAGQEVMFDYYKELFTDYDTRNDANIVGLLKEVGGMWFEDSLELTTQGHWSADMLTEFESRIGYDLADYAPYVIYISQVANADSSQSPFVMAEDNNDTVTKIRNDFVEALSGMYNDYRVQGMVDWSEAEWGMGYRVQAYGSTVDSALSSYIATIPEGESLTFSNQHDAFRAMASGRDMSNESKILSTEVGSNFSAGSAYGLTYQALVKNLNQNYASGVNMAYLHGYSYAYSPEAEWPGYHAFGGSIPGPFSSRMPEWEHITEFTDYVARTQMVLQQGEQKSDIAIYQPTYNASKGAPYYTDTGLTAAGYTYQFFTRSLFDVDTANVSDGKLNADGAAYKAMIINSNTEIIALDTVNSMIAYADAGLPFIVVGDGPSKSNNLTDSDTDVAAAMQTLLAKDNVYKVNDAGEVVGKLGEIGITAALENNTGNEKIITIHRQTDEADFYYLFNDAGEKVMVDVSLEGTGIPFVMNTWTGEITPIADYAVTENGKINISAEITTNDTLVVGITDTNILGELPETYAAEANTSVTYVDNKLAARVSASGNYEVTDNKGEIYSGEINIPESIGLNDWSLVVESWTKGKDADELINGSKNVLSTKKTKIDVGSTELKAWNEIDELGTRTSGIGTYTTTINVSEDYENLRFCMSFTNFNDTASVYVNGNQVSGLNWIDKAIDLQDYIKQGENTIKVVVASTLANALNTRNAAYGIIGDVNLIPYADIVLDTTEIVGPADTDELSALLKSADYTKDNYTSESWTAYENARNNALDVMRNKNSSQADVDDALQALEDAIAGLTRKPMSFVDVKTGDWFYDYVEYVYDNTIMTGLTSTHFGPNDNLGRAQLATILYRLEGEPDVTYSKKFADVPAGQFYSDAVTWANQNGIVTGYENGYFGTNDYVTRQDMSVMMHRYAKYKKYDVSKTAALTTFPDSAKVSGYASDAISWTLGTKIITGDGGNINPRGFASRAVAATIITRFMEEYK